MVVSLQVLSEMKIDHGNMLLTIFSACSNLIFWYQGTELRVHAVYALQTRKINFEIHLFTSASNFSSQLVNFLHLNISCLTGNTTANISHTKK